MRLIGKGEASERFMKLTLYQGKPMKNPGTQTGSNANLKKQTDPTLYSTAFKKNRFYIFSRRDPEDSESKGMSTRGNKAMKIFWHSFEYLLIDYNKKRHF
jgi:hypothetical protein